MIIVATTLAAYVMDQEATWSAWLQHAESIKASWPEPVKYFAAIEIDARGIEPFRPLIKRLAELDGDYWTFALDDGRTEVTTANRLRHITAGQNLTFDYASSNMDCTHLLFLAADLEPHPASLPLLSAVGRQVVGGGITTYGGYLRGPAVPGQPGVEEAMPSAAYVLFEREAFRQLRWRWDADAGMSDDPCMQHDARVWGWEPVVHWGCLGRHWPESIPAIEHRGHDMRVVRA